MKTFRVTVSLTIAVLFFGCPARSIHPLFSENDATFNSTLVGIWSNEDETYTFEKGENKSYSLVIRPKTENDSVIYTVISGTIGSMWFLDSYPLLNSDEYHFLSTHLISKMEISGDTLRMSSLEADWLLKKVERKEIKIDHIRRENEIILTASTKELQKFISKIATNTEAFPDPNVLVRVR